MDEEVASIVQEDDDDLAGEESNVEHCIFPWTIKEFLDVLERDSEHLGTLMFAASSKEESFTLWQIDLSFNVEQNDIQIDLKRLKSQNQALVFVRFIWEIIDANGNKVFPGSFHSLAYPNDKLSKKFIEIDKLLEDEPRFFRDGNLCVSCELTAYERTVEEQIYSQVKGNIPSGLNGLTDDLEALFFTGSDADMRISSVDATIRCHKSILSARSNEFSRLIQAKQSGDCHLLLGELKHDVLLAILTHLYLGCVDMYLEHAIPKDLYSIATEYGLKDLQQHLDHVNTNSLTTLKSLDVTWKLPYFKLLVLQPKVTLCCPEPNTSTLYDKRWFFKLEFDSSREGVDISVVRRQGEVSAHHVKFVVKVVRYGRICFEEWRYFFFKADGSRGIEAFVTKDELSSMLTSDDTLNLKCYLEVIGIERASPRLQVSRLQTLVEQLSTHVEDSLLKMAEDLRRMYKTEIFSDAVVSTSIGKIAYHSFMARARFDVPNCDFISFVGNLDRNLVQSFFLFLYGGDLLRKKARDIKEAAEMKNLLSIVEKFENFLYGYQG